jgi:UDP-N-acetylmuramate--alanine ligase
MKHAHFIGIAGVGMSGLAHVLLQRGYRVSGSDPASNAATERLLAEGAILYSSQDSVNIQREQPDIVIATAAIHTGNPELEAAKNAGIPILTRAELLGKVMSTFAGPRIAVTGTHGKTTVTSMIASILIAAEMDPTVLVGGEFAAIGGNVQTGNSDVFLTEACEAYDSFLSLYPDIAVLTNIEADHLDHYGTVENLFQGFRQFCSQIQENGTLAWCGEDPGARRLASIMKNQLSNVKLLRYGFTPDNEEHGMLADDVDSEQGRFHFTLKTGKGEVLGRVKLSVPGRHNAMNALAAAAAALSAGASAQSIVQGLETFEGTGRRFETLGDAGDISIIDDYAHHPSEIRATLAAAREAFPNRRIVAIFQPHLFSRTRDFMLDFAHALAGFDLVILTDIYPAREEPIPGISSETLMQQIKTHTDMTRVYYIADMKKIAYEAISLLNPEDVIFTIGAGTIREAGEQLLVQLRKN